MCVKSDVKVVKMTYETQIVSNVFSLWFSVMMINLGDRSKS